MVYVALLIQCVLAADKISKHFPFKRAIFYTCIDLSSDDKTKARQEEKAYRRCTAVPEFMQDELFQVKELKKMTNLMQKKL